MYVSLRDPADPVKGCDKMPTTGEEEAENFTAWNSTTDHNSQKVFTSVFMRLREESVDPEVEE